MIREAVLDDASELAMVVKKVESESNFMLYKAGERNPTPEGMKEMTKELMKTENSAIFVAEVNNRLAGYLFAIGGKASKNKHCAYIVIGILSAYQRQGIGTNLFEKVEHWALKQQIHRLELTVITENTAGIKLYRKAGFEIEGVKRHSLYMEGNYYDEYYMGKLLEVTKCHT